MGQAASAESATSLTSVRVLFLDEDNKAAYEYTSNALKKYPEVTTVLATPASVAEEINRADVFVTVNSPVSKGMIARAATLKLICLFGSDVSDIDLEAAAVANIPVTRISSKDAGIAESCAEHALHLALDLLRLARPTFESTRLGKNLCGMTAIVFGNGGLGQRLTFLLQAMGSDASCVNPDNNDYFDELRNADIIFFCCGVKKSTQKIVNADFLQKTKNEVYVVSISKHQLLNLDELQGALQSNRVAGLALDSRHSATKHAVLSDRRVFVSPTTSDATEVTYNCIAHIVAGNIVRALRGEQLMDVVVSREVSEVVDTIDEVIEVDAK